MQVLIKKRHFSHKQRDAANVEIEIDNGESSRSEQEHHLGISTAALPTREHAPVSPHAASQLDYSLTYETWTRLQKRIYLAVKDPKSNLADVHFDAHIDVHFDELINSI